MEERSKKSNSYSHSISNKSKIERIKNKKELRLKLIRLSNNYFKPRCEHFINNIRAFNLKILEFSGGKKSVEKEIREKNKFHFGKRKDYFIHLTDLSPYKIEISPFLKKLKENFTQEEIETIKKNREYYLQNELLKENISMFNVPPLYQILNKEEIEEKQRTKVFHNLNYFNKKRRKSIIDIYQKINEIKSGNNNMNILSNINKTYEIKHRKLNKNIENSVSEHYNLKKNMMNIIENEIRKGIKKLNKEKLNDNNLEKNKNLILEIEKESKAEIKEILKQKKRNNYTINYIINSPIKKKKKLPLLKNRTFSKNKRDKLDILNKTNSKEKKADLTKKIIEYEQSIIRDVNRKIKAVYEDKNKKNIF